MKSFLDFEEKNVEKAVQKACNDLNVSRDKLKYDIISHGSSGIFGLVGTKKALIRVFVPDLHNGKSGADASSAAAIADNALNGETTLSHKETVNALVDEAFGEVSAPAAAPEKPEKPKKNKMPRKPAHTEKSEKAPRPKKTVKPHKAVQESKELQEVKVPPAAEETPVIEAVKPVEAVDVAETVTDERDLPPETAAPVDEKLQAANNEAATTVAQELAREIFKTMDVDAEMSAGSDSDQCWINVKVAEPGILIGKRGQTLEAIQYLVDKVVNKQCGKGSRVIFDVEGYVESRKTELKELAARLASKAVKTGKPSTMTRMNAHDRRIVHVTLKRNRSVRTQSVGDGYYRKLIIFPKKKSHKKTEKAPETK